MILSLLFGFVFARQKADKFREISFEGLENGTIYITFKRLEQNVKFQTNTAFPIIAESKIIFLNGIASNTETEDMSPDDKRKVLEVLDEAEVSISMNPGEFFPDWVTLTNWKSCRVSAKININRKSLKVSSMYNYDYTEEYVLTSKLEVPSRTRKSVLEIEDESKFEKLAEELRIANEKIKSLEAENQILYQEKTFLLQDQIQCYKKMSNLVHKDCTKP